MDESETRSIEVSQAEAREIISGLAKVETTVSTESTINEQNIISLRDGLKSVSILKRAEIPRIVQIRTPYQASHRDILE
jgi:hypothetical protein